MFARRTKIVLGAQTVAETPLLLPSFSSKGFPQVRQIMSLMAEFITGPILISSYDVHYRLIPKKITFPQLLFLDSGGYEARVEHDLSETYGKLHKPRKWSQQLYERVLTHWSSKWPTIAVSFDSPAKFLGLSKQIDGAVELQKRYPHLLWELLVKPETAKDTFISFEKLIKRVEHLRRFAVVGITEKELDDSLFGAMTKIARLRTQMNAAGIDIPIHIFGSLDPLTTVLYFLAGAEIFDGLTWLRFGYHAGKTIYYQNYAVIRDSTGLRRRTHDQYHEMWRSNYYYLEKLRTQMINFVRTGDLTHFEAIHPQLSDALTQLQATVPETR
ncbi:MAG: hypothetical protein LAO04_16005 [Acidobacteriia bacterium]|nr:hypothetical protein [Terriglobia bacterium]